MISPGKEETKQNYNGQVLKICKKNYNFGRLTGAIIKGTHLARAILTFEIFTIHDGDMMNLLFGKKLYLLDCGFDSSR